LLSHKEISKCMEGLMNKINQWEEYLF
jgi:hypothetical protein